MKFLIPNVPQIEKHTVQTNVPIRYRKNRLGKSQDISGRKKKHKHSEMLLILEKSCKNF